MLALPNSNPLSPTFRRMKTTKRPLQTYGKSAAHAAGKENAPPPKRQRRDLKDTTDSEPTGNPMPESARLPLQTHDPVASLPRDAPVNAAAVPTQPRSSILAYFQRLPPTSRPQPATSSTTASETPIPSSTPPPSPPPVKSRTRVRRRLNSRPERIREEKERGTEDNAAGGTEREGLDDRTRKRKRRREELTQTTLSLSLTEDAGFQICDVCHILYNPLNDKDRKEHSRRHAAFIRSAKKLIKNTEASGFAGTSHKPCRDSLDTLAECLR
jgi:hypothetical protein